MTEQFVDAAQLMARVLGADGYPFMIIDHPISSAGPADLTERARLTAERCAESLARNGSGGSNGGQPGEAEDVTPDG